MHTLLILPPSRITDALRRLQGVLAMMAGDWPGQELV